MSEFYEMNNISKAFPGVQALDNVDFNLKKGEVLGLIGENGAGKSTLIKIIGGIINKDSGSVSLDGSAVDIRHPKKAEELGISIIHQELNLLPNLTIADNIFIGREKTSAPGVIDEAKMRNEASSLLDKVGLKVSPETLVEELSVSQKQMVEIAKALSFESRIIIMDEPTSSLTDSEVEILFSIIGELKKMDVAIVYVSHKMEEIFKLCDRVQILRDGKHIDTLKLSETTEDEIITLMVGRKLETLFEKTEHPIGEEVLRVENLSTDNGVKNISFSLRRGEVLGFAGLVGAGRSEVMRAIFGLDKVTGGLIFLGGREVSMVHPSKAIASNLGFVPEDRKKQGLVLDLSVKENVSMANLDAVSNLGVVDLRKEKTIVKGFIDKLRLKTPNEDAVVSSLSGGNQQKVVLAKWLSTKPRILILDEPTRGIDVGAKKEIYHIINELAGEGVSIIMISSELIEILSMSDRIVVMHEGEWKGTLDASEASQELIMTTALSANGCE